MNKLKILYIIFSFALVSCNDSFLDKSPNDVLSEKTFWTCEADAKAGLVSIYDALTPISSVNPERACVTWSTLGILDLITPIGTASMNSIVQIAEGTHNGSANDVLQPWRHSYRGISRANDFLDHIDNIPLSKGFAQEDKEKMIGEAKFLRAMYYYMLVELYGDVPLFEHVMTVADAQTPRSPKKEVLDLIKADLDYAIKYLPEPIKGEVGRANQGAALALKVKVALYERDWNTVVNASAQIMNLGYKLVPNYGDVININNENNEEIIFSVQHVYNNPGELGNFAEKLYANPSCSSNGWCYFQPALWLVDQYERIIESPVEGVDYVNEDPERIPDEMYKYFEGRDPRMDYTILRPGSHFIDLKDNDILYPHDFVNGNKSQTGLMMRKYVVPGKDTSKQWDSPLDVVIFRYADILLCYLEGVAMQNGVQNVSQEVLDKTINEIRKRASDKLPKYKMGQIEMKDIYHERIVELAFEGWTYFDMKRSKMIELNNGYQIHGLLITLKKTVTFNPSPLRNIRSFDPDTHYVFPIPSSEIEKSNGALTQNPNYPL